MMTTRFMCSMGCVLTVVISAGACGGEKAAPDPAALAPAEATAPPSPEPAIAAAAVDPRVQRALDIAREVEVDPAKADAVLAKHGLDREKLDALMIEISRDQVLRESYNRLRAG